jgi:hypothetical protein
MASDRVSCYNQSSPLMHSKRQSLGRNVLVVGIVAGLISGWWGGCSQSGSTSLNLTKARAALSKRWADYDNTPRSQPRTREKAPVRRR